MAFGKLSAELLDRIQGGIHLAPQLLFSRADRRDEIRQRYVIAHNQKIDVTCRFFAALGHGPKNEGQLNPVTNPLKCFSEDVRDAECFSNESTQFLEDWAFCVGLKVPLSAVNGALQDLRPP